MRAPVTVLADKINPRLRLLVLLAGWCGLRKGELLALRRQNIDLLARTISVDAAVKELRSGERLIGPPKTQAGRRKIAIPEPLLLEIEVHLNTYVGTDDDAFVFTGPKGGILRSSALYSDWRKARNSLGMGYLHLHDLRHTAATFAASTGATTSELMARLGHSSPQAALRYQHATAEGERKIADRLGQIMIQPNVERRSPAPRI
jgi:integrase